MAPIRTEPIIYPGLFQIEETAASISKAIGLNDIFPRFRYRFLFDQFKTRRFGRYEIQIVCDDDLDAAATLDSPNKKLYLKASIHAFGLRGDPHPLMTLLHEAVHVFLKHRGVRNKIPGSDIRKLKNANEKFDEWIANRVAGAIAMPFIEAVERECYREDDLIRVFGVTSAAAKQRIQQIDEMRREWIAPKKASTERFWKALRDYENKTGSRLGIVQDEEGKRRLSDSRANGYMLRACPGCGRSDGQLDSEGLCCGFCGTKLAIEVNLPVSLHNK